MKIIKNPPKRGDMHCSYNFARIQIWYDIEDIFDKFLSWGLKLTTDNHKRFVNSENQPSHPPYFVLFIKTKGVNININISEKSQPH